MADRTLTLAVFNEATEWRLPEALVTRIEESVPKGMDVRGVGSRAELVRALPETTDLVGFPLTETQFVETGAELRWVQLVGAGGEALAPVRAALERGARVTGAASIRAPQASEHAIALALALSRRLHESMRAQLEHTWSARESAPHVLELGEMTVGLPDFGPIADALARRLRAFGCEIIITTDREEPPLYADLALPPESLDELMARADIVFVTAPFALKSRRPIGRAQLSQMKPSGMLVDVSRGGIVNHGDLVRALQAGALAGAAIDVFELAPLPSDSPLWTMPNLIVTPHLSPVSRSYWPRAVDLALRNLGRLDAGRALIDELDLTMLGGLR